MASPEEKERSIPKQPNFNLMVNEGDWDGIADVLNAREKGLL